MWKSCDLGAPTKIGLRGKAKDSLGVIEKADAALTTACSRIILQSGPTPSIDPESVSACRLAGKLAH